MLQKYDGERDELQRQWQAAVWGVGLTGKAPSGPSGPLKQPDSKPRKQTMTTSDIMRNYGKVNG